MPEEGTADKFYITKPLEWILFAIDEENRAIVQTGQKVTNHKTQRIQLCVPYMCNFIWARLY